MGGVVRIVSRALGITPKAPPPPAPAPAQTAAKTPEPATSKAALAKTADGKKASLGSGYGGDSTVMTSTSGVEEEANTSKTVLGGTSSAGKKKKTSYGTA